MKSKKIMIMSICMALVILASITPVSAMMAGGGCTAEAWCFGTYITCSVVTCNGSYGCGFSLGFDECSVTCWCEGGGVLEGGWAY